VEEGRGRRTRWRRIGPGLCRPGWVELSELDGMGGETYPCADAAIAF